MLMISCTAEQQPRETAFYYWKSGFQLDTASEQLLDSLHVKRLFVKYMDVDLVDGYASPVAPIRFEGSAHQRFEIVPCVFITNRTWLTENVNPGLLAERVWDYIQQINQEAELIPMEYQFDCDWTNSTRAAYFAFLSKIKTLSGEALISSTLRLHQYRYPEQAGVPPADKAALMYYNMGDIEDVEEPNSILNNQKGQPYLAAKEYPLELDVALPVFSWILLYRLGRLEKIIQSIPLDSLRMNDAFEKTGENTFLVNQNLYFGGHYLNKGDQLRLEAPTAASLEDAAQGLNKIENQSGTLLFYHLDESLHLYYPFGVLDRVAGIYHQ
jgi:hypothetical protein